MFKTITGLEKQCQSSEHERKHLRNQMKGAEIIIQKYVLIVLGNQGKRDMRITSYKSWEFENNRQDRKGREVEIREQQ